MNVANPYIEEIEDLSGIEEPLKDLYVLYHISKMQSKALVVQMKALLSDGFGEFMLPALRQLQLILEKVVYDANHAAFDAGHSFNIAVAEELLSTEVFTDMLNSFNTWYCHTRKAENLTLTTALPMYGISDLIDGLHLAAGRFFELVDDAPTQQRYNRIRDHLCNNGYPYWRNKFMNLMCTFANMLKPRVQSFYEQLSNHEMLAMLPMCDMYQTFDMEENGFAKLQYYSLLVDNQKKLLAETNLALYAGLPNNSVDEFNDNE